MQVQLEYMLRSYLLMCGELVAREPGADIPWHVVDHLFTGTHTARSIATILDVSPESVMMYARRHGKKYKRTRKVSR